MLIEFKTAKAKEWAKKFVPEDGDGRVYFHGKLYCERQYAKEIFEWFVESGLQNHIDFSFED
jgi:hypothetical protein